MSVSRLTLAAGQTVSAPIRIPASYQNWQGVGVSLLLNFSGGGPATGTVTVQVSNDPVAPTSPTTARWNAHDVLVNMTGDRNSSLAYPCAFVRLSGTVTGGTVALDVGMPDTSPPNT